MKNILLLSVILISTMLYADKEIPAPSSPEVEAFVDNAFKGNLEAVKQYVNNGGDINAVNGYKQTALIKAAFSGHTNVVEFLLHNKASVNNKDMYDDTAIMWACYNGHYDVVYMLLQVKGINTEKTIQMAKTTKIKELIIKYNQQK